MICNYKDCINYSMQKETYDMAIAGYSALIEECIECSNDETCKSKCHGLKAFYYHNRGYVYLKKGDYTKAAFDYNRALEIFFDKDCYCGEVLNKKRCISETMLSLSLVNSKQTKHEVAYECIIKGIHYLLADEGEEHHIENLSMSNIVNIELNLDGKNERDFIDVLGRLYYEIGKNYEKTDSIDKLELHRKCLCKAKMCFDKLDDDSLYTERNLKEFGTRTLCNLIIISYRINSRNNQMDDCLDDYMKELCDLLEKERDERERFVCIVAPNVKSKNQFYNDLITYNELLYVSRTKAGYIDNWIYQACKAYLESKKSALNSKAELYSFKYFIKFIQKEIELILDDMKKLYPLSIYKFYSLNTESFEKLIKNLSNRELFFSTPDWYADMENECSPYSEILNKLPENTQIHRFFRELQPYSGSKYKKASHYSYGTSGYAFFPAIKKELDSYPNKRINFYHMWNNYAAAYNGICVEYKIEGIYNNFNFDIESNNYNILNYTRNNYYKKVKDDLYNELKKLILVKNVDYKSFDRFKKDIENKGEKFNVSGLIDVLLFSKPEDWSAENEIRFASFFDLTGNGQFQTKKIYKDMIEYNHDNQDFDSGYILGRIDKIIFGYKIADCREGNEDYTSLSSRLTKSLVEAKNNTKTDECLGVEISKIFREYEKQEYGKKVSKIRCIVDKLADIYDCCFTDIGKNMPEKAMEDLTKYHNNL